ncbi:MAG: hypothetical protein ACE5E5_06010 [Phycisphaerae bacterium]
MPESAAGIEAVHGVIVAPPARSKSVSHKRISPISITLIASTLFAGSYAGYQRWGTVANADTVEYTQNFGGGFLAIGMTQDQPGFVLLSGLDREKVEVRADQTRNRLAGTHTTIEIQTPRASLSVRLRGPEVLLVTENGHITRHGVDWTVDDFNALRAAVDCATHETAEAKHRCGQPFTDLHEALAAWPQRRIPQRVRAFLAPFREHRRTGRKRD